MKFIHLLTVLTILSHSLIAEEYNLQLKSVIGGEAMRHGARITKLIPLPGNKQFLSSSEDGSFRIWDLTKNKEIKRYKFTENIKAGEDEIWNIQLHPDGKKVLTAQDNGFIHLWDLKKDKPIRTFDNKGKRVFRLAFLPNGQRFIAVDSSGKVKIGDLSKDENTLKTIGKHSDDAYTVAISSDGKTAWTGGGDSKILGWDLTEDKLNGKEYTSEEDIYTISPSPDSSKLIVVTDESFLILLDSHTLKVIWKKKFSADGYIATWTPDGKRIVTTGKEITIIDALKGDIIKSIPIKGPSHSSIALTSDGKEILSGDKIIYRYDLKTGQQVYPKENSVVLEGNINDISVLNSGKVYLAANKKVEVWSLENKRESSMDFDSYIRMVRFSKDQSHFAVAMDKNIHVYATKNQKEIIKLTTEDGDEFAGFVGNDKLLLKTASEEYSLINFKQNKTLKTYPVEDIKAVSPNDKFFLTAKYKKPIKVWNLKTGQNVATFQLFNETENISNAVFSADSNSILAVQKQIIGGGVLLKKEKTIPQQEFNELVKKLGAKSYKDRRNASKELEKFGTALIPEIEKLPNIEDPEVRMRLREIKGKLQSVQNLPKKLTPYINHNENFEGIYMHPSKELWAAKVEENAVRGKIMIGGFKQGKPVIFQTIYEGRGVEEISFDSAGNRIAVANTDSTISIYDIIKKNEK